MARINGPRKVYRYDTIFKLKAVRLSQFPGVRVKDVAKSLDIHPFMLSKWRKLYSSGQLVATDEVTDDLQSSAELLRFKQMEREYLRLQQEYGVLKKALQSVWPGLLDK